MTDEDLRTLFEQYGSVTSAKIVKDKVSGRSKGFGFVEMPDDTEAQNALSSLYDSEVLGRKIIVNEAQPKPQKVAAAVADLREKLRRRRRKRRRRWWWLQERWLQQRRRRRRLQQGLLKFIIYLFVLKSSLSGRFFCARQRRIFGEKGPPTQATSISSSSGG